MDRKPAPDDDAADDKPLGRDDRVSLYPLSFEDVVRALHKTPPMPRSKDKPSRDKGKK